MAISNMLFNLKIVVVAYRKGVFVGSEIIDTIVNRCLVNSLQRQQGLVIDAKIASSFVSHGWPNRLARQHSRRFPTATVLRLGSGYHAVR